MADNVQVAARISAELHEKLVAFAKKTGRSKSKAIARAIAAYLGCPEEMEIEDRVVEMEDRLASLETRETEQLTIAELVTELDESPGTMPFPELPMDMASYQQAHQQLEAAIAEQIWKLKQLHDQLEMTAARLERVSPQTGELPLLLPQNPYQSPGEANRSGAGSKGTGKQQLMGDLLLYLQLKFSTGNFEATDCNQVLRDVLAVCNGALKESGARLTFDYLPTVIADELRLLDLFEHLITNAIKFRRPEVPLKIHVSAAPQNGQWQFVVQDNGIGIPRKHLDRIFGMFQRLHDASDYPGTGMGLASCKLIVEIHGGRIWAESRRGVGSSFYFTIPWQPGR
ncbi:MAG: ATP-binding protein [Hormoscilla sp.]